MAVPGRKQPVYFDHVTYQPRVENEHYFVTYFDSIAVFEALSYRQGGEFHTYFVCIRLEFSLSPLLGPLGGLPVDGGDDASVEDVC